MGFEKFFKNLKSKEEEPDNTIERLEKAEQEREKKLEDFFRFLRDNYGKQGEIGIKEVGEIVSEKKFGKGEEIKELLEELVKRGYLIEKGHKKEKKYIFDFSADFRQDMAA